MTRLEGFLFSNPGFRSFVVPYHDTNDFYYSGHVGVCTLVALEYYSSKWYKMSYFTTFILINQWIMMMLVRTHYIIDMVTGLIMAHYVFMWSERIAFYVDAKFWRIPVKLRQRKFYKPCKHCGWSNKCAGDFMTLEEKQKLKLIYFQ